MCKTLHLIVCRRTHSFEGAAAGQAVGVQRLGTVLTRWDQLVYNNTSVLIVTTSQLLHTGNLHPETCHLLLQSHIQLDRRQKQHQIYKKKKTQTTSMASKQHGAVKF